MNRPWWVILPIVVCMIMMLSNKKVRLIRIFIRQFQIYKNAQNEKNSTWDIVCFIFLPIIISILIVYGLQYQIDSKLAGTLTTVFSLIFTVLFGFAAVIVEKGESYNDKKNRVIGETFVSIITSTVFSLVAAIFSIILTIIKWDIIISIVSVVLFALSFHIIMLLLMITKRTFVIYCEGE